MPVELLTQLLLLNGNPVNRSASAPNSVGVLPLLAIADILQVGLDRLFPFCGLDELAVQLRHEARGCVTFVLGWWNEPFRLESLGRKGTQCFVLGWWNEPFRLESLGRKGTQ